MAKLDTQKTIDQWKEPGKISPRYDLCQKNIRDIYVKNQGMAFGMITDAFILGYAQGTKASQRKLK